MHLAPGTSRRTDMAILVACVVASTLLRLAFQASYRADVGIDTRLVDGLDTRTFHLWAVDIADGDLLGADQRAPVHHWWARRIADRELWNPWLGDPTFPQSPLYPYLLAVVYATLGQGEAVVPFLQALLGGLVTGLVFWMGLRMVGRRGALVAGLLHATCAPSVFYSQFLLRATLLELMVAGVVACLIARPTPSRRWVVLEGALLGLSVLAKPVLVALVPVAVLSLHGRARLRGAGLLLLGILLVLTPVFIRNALVGARIFSLSTRGPAAFIAGNASASDGLEWFPERNRDVLLDVQARTILREHGWSLRKVILPTLLTHAENPAGFLWLSLNKLWFFFRADELPNNLDFPVTRRLVPLLALLPDLRWIAALGLLGLVLAWRERETRVVGSALVLLTLVTIAFFVVGRFRAPVIPLLALLSGGAVARLLDLVPSRGSRNTGRSWLRLALAGSLLAGLLALVWPAFPPPSLPRATFDRAFLLASQARTLQAEGRVDEGLSCVNRALGLFVTVAAGPGDPERPHLVESALSQQAGLLVDVFGDIDRGQDLYGEVLRRLGTEGEDTTLLWFRLGTHASLGNIARARYDANLVGKDALDRARSEYESARALGDRLESLGHDNVEVRETRAWVEDLLAHLALVEGDEPRARSAYVRALRIVPEDAAALYGRARLDILAARRGELGSPGETRDLLLRAERDLTRASSADPPPDRIEVMHSLLAEVRARLGEE